jgi:hypothetical protein
VVADATKAHDGHVSEKGHERKVGHQHNGQEEDAIVPNGLERVDEEVIERLRGLPDITRSTSKHA